MTQRVPQLVVTLTPTGALAVELPGQQATRRKIELSPKTAHEVLVQILEGQMSDQTEIGLDGAPTEAQVKHWEQHSQWPKMTCRFCQAEGRVQIDRGAGLRRPKKIILDKRSDGVEIRRIPERLSGKRVARSRKSAEDLGL